MTDDLHLPDFLTNHDLFQDYYLVTYLAQTLPLAPDEVQQAHDQARAQQDANHILALLAQQWHAQRSRLRSSSTSEADIEDFVKTVCHMLGMVASSQGSVPRHNASAKRVDLVLFADETDGADFVQRTQQRQRAKERYARALALVEVKKVGIDFDAGGDSSPARQIVQYLTLTGVPWGILTDGHRWRIYRRFDVPRFGVFCEVNLANILAIADQEERQQAFWWFYAFFQQGAFNRFATQHTSRLTQFYNGSQQYAVGVQDALRDQAFRVVEELAGGMYATHSTPDTADLNVLYNQAIILLYRLLFLKFAEDKAILPIHNPVYRQQYGYTSVERDLLAHLDNPTYILGTDKQSVAFWTRLSSLFTHLNNGNQHAGIFAYNGGLFQPSNLNATTSVPDAYLARALDHLARITRNGQKQRISYRDLSTRHLGSIYEGLLEQRLARVNGTVHLVSSAGQPLNERRTSGSYYTPDYIVDYIVQQTIDPLCDGKTAEEIKQFTILDPAMGSGHFLVTALSRLAQHHALARRRSTHPSPRRDPGETDADYAARLDAHDAETEPTMLEVAASERELVEHCIYGVDLNPLAVELAKLSLWLSTLSSDRPLSFLDHHLRVGNSLIGGRIDQLGTLTMATTPQPARRLFAVVLDRVRDQMLAYFQTISAMPSTTAAEIHAKADAFATFRTYSQPLRQVAHSWVSHQLGHTLSEAQYEQCLNAVDDYYATPPDTTAWEALEQEAWFLHAQQHAAHAKFFHWELEFPQVLLDEPRGFDAVVGNPPWGSDIDQATYNYLRTRFHYLHQRLPDTAKYFFGVYHETATHHGRVGLILPNVTFYSHEYTRLRELWLDNYHIKQLRNLGDGIFKGVTTPSSIIIAQMQNNISDPIVGFSDYRHIPRDFLFERLHKNTIELRQSQLKAIPGYTFVEDVVGLQLLLRLYKTCTILGELTKEVSSGVVTGSNVAFLLTDDEIHQKSIEQSAVWSLLRGEDIHRYSSPQKPPLSIIYASWDFDAVIHPNTMQHLEPYRDKLKKRREVVQGKMPWYALHWSRNRTLYSSPKIICRQTADTLIAAVDTYGHCVLNTVIVIRPRDSAWSPFFWVTVLNSRLLRYVYNLLVQEEDRTFAEVKPVNLRKLPIRRISFTTPEEDRIRLRDEAIAAYTSGDHAAVLAAVEACLTADPEQADVVHDVLAYLAQQMTTMNVQRHEQLTYFLTDLEGEMAASEWKKLGKTRQLWNPATKKARATTDADGVLGDLAGQVLTIDDHLGSLTESQWQWLLKHKLGRVSQLARLTAVYNRYHTVLATLGQDLAATDTLIDQIVYRLYGLTDAEIALIEAG